MGKPKCVALASVLFAAVSAAAMDPELIYYWDHLVQPYAALCEAPDHSFYSTTAGQASYYDYGSVYRVTTNGTLTTLAFFDASNGAYPNSLTLANDNNFYGTTKYGGAYGYGTVFKLSTNGQLTALVSFNYTNGATPFAALLQGPDGFLYGSTYTGGKTNSLNISTNYAGTVFKVSTNGELTSLVTFSDTNGWGPKGRLAWGPDGLLYGTTVYGGIGQGTVFKVTTNGDLTSLISFGGTNGSYPQAGMTFGPDGNFYGTTQSGAYNNGYGTVFRITTNGDLTTLVPFQGSGGSSPDADLLLAPDGKLYGTTPNSYVAASGKVFQVTTNGTLTILVSFNGPNGGLPRSGLTLGSDGNFYGVASLGGPAGYGTVFRLNTRPQITGVARRGQDVVLSGTGLPNDPYRVWAATDIASPLSSWTSITSNFFSATGNMSYAEPATNSLLFYRLSVP